MSTPKICNRDPGDEAQEEKPRDVLVESLLAENNKLRAIIKRAHTDPRDSDAVADILLAE